MLEYYRQIKPSFICTSATWKVITSLSSTDHHWPAGRLNSCEGEPLHYFPILLCSCRYLWECKWLYVRTSGKAFREISQRIIHCVPVLDEVGSSDSDSKFWWPLVSPSQNRQKRNLNRMRGRSNVRASDNFIKLNFNQQRNKNLLGEYIEKLLWIYVIVWTILSIGKKST